MGRCLPRSGKGCGRRAVGERTPAAQHGTSTARDCAHSKWRTTRSVVPAAPKARPKGRTSGREEKVPAPRHGGRQRLARVPNGHAHMPNAWQPRLATMDLARGGARRLPCWAQCGARTLRRLAKLAGTAGLHLAETLQDKHTHVRWRRWKQGWWAHLAWGHRGGNCGAQSGGAAP